MAVCHVSNVMCQVSCVTSHISHFMCHISLVTYPLSPTPTATATDPPPNNSLTMHRRLVHRQTEPKKYMYKKNNPKKGFLVLQF